jgi:hypothetical protein
MLPALACPANMMLFVCLPMLLGTHTADTAEEKATNDELVALRGELAGLGQALAHQQDTEVRKAAVE